VKVSREPVAPARGGVECVVRLERDDDRHDADTHPDPGAIGASGAKASTIGPTCVKISNHFGRLIGAVLRHQL
jgi:hypothetical protein